MLELNQVKAILKPQFEYLAKSHGEVLWLHSFAVWSILAKLAARIPRFTDRERLLLEISALIHDIGKIRPKNQDILTNKREGKLIHTASKEEIVDYLSPFIDCKVIPIRIDDIDQIWEFALHHYISKAQQQETQTPAHGIYAEVIRYADWLSSMDQIDMATVRMIQNNLEGICRLVAFNIGRYPSPATYCLLQEATNSYHSLGWETLVVFDNGALFIGDTDSMLPSKNEISKNFTQKLIEESFRGMSIQNKYMRYEILSGNAKEDPLSFLLAKKDIYLGKLGDIEIGPVLFFRTLLDLYENSNKITPRVRNKLPVIDILRAASGTRSINIAKLKWSKRQKYDKNKNWPSTNALIIDIFNNVTIGDILYDESLDPAKRLNEMTAGELFTLLTHIAKRWFPEHSSSFLEEAVSRLISMEEETDFATMAKEALERYKNYKKTRKPQNALCEQCGFIVPIVATASLNFPKSSGFSQVNPRPESDAPRVVCPLCVFDAMYTRKDLPTGRSQVYVRVVSRTPELWQLYGNIETYMDRLRQSLINFREIRELAETDFSDLPLPKTFMIPIPNKYDKTQMLIPIRTERGALFPIERVSHDESPKNLRAKYLAFYALLNMMGLEAHMGLEEQEGLFGERIFEKHTENWQDLYYKGLIINILAQTTKKSNKYVFAQSLLDQSPSAVLSNLEDTKIKKELLEKVFLFLIRANLKISEWKGGKYTMKEILQDAAFFAEWIPKFFWGSKDYESWRTGRSKYVITKPVDRVLNAILQGDDFEEAFAKFLSGLKEDISSDKTKEGSRATVDVKDMEFFMAEAKKIFRRYADLRNENITKFIQAKNGLRSAIYVVKRYENLKEVIKNATA